MMIIFSKKFSFLSRIFLSFYFFCGASYPIRLLCTPLNASGNVVPTEKKNEKNLENVLAKHPQYQGLRNLWKHYNASKKDIKIPQSFLKKPIKKKDAKEQHILIQRLFQLGFLQSDQPDIPYQRLIHAVKRFQKSCNLTASGQIDHKTLHYLNRSLKNWRHHIWQNLERWRNTLSEESRYVFINIPQGLLYFFQDHRPIFISKVVVGKYDSPTVPFQNRIKSLLTHPTWYVPPCLSEKLRQNVGSRGYALSKDGALIQKPCAHNPLGAIKFLFSTPAVKSIILHSTNKPHLFERNQRFFSLGCIRVQEYQALARLLLSTEQWEKFSLALQKQKSCVFQLPSSTPISVAYITIWIDPEGYFRLVDDFYDQDDEDIDSESTDSDDNKAEEGEEQD
jgi:L,D-transpeptidase YcbB